jgi:hypothetical protein
MGSVLVLGLHVMGSVLVLGLHVMGSVLVAYYEWFLQPDIFSFRLCMVPSTRHFLFQLLFSFYLEAKVHAEFFCCYFVELTFENRGDVSFAGSETLDLYCFPILVWLCLSSKPLL